MSGQPKTTSLSLSQYTFITVGYQLLYVKKTSSSSHFQSPNNLFTDNKTHITDHPILASVSVSFPKPPNPLVLYTRIHHTMSPKPTRDNPKTQAYHGYQGPKAATSKKKANQKKCNTKSSQEDVHKLWTSIQSPPNRDGSNISIPLPHLYQSRPLHFP